MYWFPYLSLPINLIKALTENRNLRSWVVIALNNLSTDVMLSLYSRVYELTSWEPISLN